MAFGLGRRKSVVEQSVEEDLPPLATVVERRHARVRGQVFRVKLRPSNGMPSLEVTLTDETGSVVAVWFGRRSIGGVGLGREMIVEGVPVRTPDGLTFTNPAYELR